MILSDNVGEGLGTPFSCNHLIRQNNLWLKKWPSTPYHIDSRVPLLPSGPSGIRQGCYCMGPGQAQVYRTPSQITLDNSLHIFHGNVLDSEEKPLGAAIGSRTGKRLFPSIDGHDRVPYLPVFIFRSRRDVL